MNPKKLLPVALGLVLSAVSASAMSTTITGTLPTDASTYLYNFSSTGAQNFVFSTDSYGGGTNLSGTVYAAGGFVPVLTLFNATTGAVIGTDGGSGMQQSSSMQKDPTTGLYDDAYLAEVLTGGKYTLALSEFPNGAAGNNLSDGFQFAGQGNFTGGLCGTSGGFYETDVDPCVKRVDRFSANISSASTSVTPEPASWMLVLPAVGLFGVFGRRLLA